MQNESYKAAGVDVTAGYRAVELMKSDVKRTHNSCVPEDIGGFGGLFIPELSGMKEPVLVSGTDVVTVEKFINQFFIKVFMKFGIFYRRLPVGGYDIAIE